MEKVRWGIIGCGDVTEVKSGPALYKSKNSELVAVMRRDSSKAEDYAKRHNVSKWYNDADELINDNNVNVVYIATPPSSHCEYTVKAAEKGKPVYVEKPMAANYEECLKMIEACKKNNVPLFVAYYRRMLPYFVKVRQLIEEGEIGRITSVNIILHQPPNERDYKRDKTNWRVDPEIAGAGYFYDLASHQFDFLDQMLGPIKTAKGISGNSLNLYDAEDNVQAVFEFESGIIGNGSWNFTTSKQDKIDLISFYGTEGSIKFSTFARDPIQLNNLNGELLFVSEFPDHVHQPLVETIVAELTGIGKCPSMGKSWCTNQLGNG
jgi:predicted dehydrogenase